MDRLFTIEFKHKAELLEIADDIQFNMVEFGKIMDDGKGLHDGLSPMQMRIAATCIFGIGNRLAHVLHLIAGEVDER